MRLNDAVGRTTLLAYVLSVSGLFFLTWLAHDAAKWEQEAARWVEHTRDVIALNNRILQQTQSLESAERAYLLTGYAHLVKNVAGMSADTRERMHDLKLLTSDNATQQKQIAALEELVNQELELIEARIYLHDHVGLEQAQQSIMRSEGREGMELIDGLAKKIESEELRLLQVRTADYQQMGWRAASLRHGIVISSVILLTILFWYLNRILHRKREAEAKVQHLAYHDALTGLPNRRLLLDRLKQNAMAAERQTGSFAVLFLDLDGFKKVNDTLGHDGGDELLQQVAQRLQGLLRESDTVARLGGDEFVIGLMLTESIDDAIAVAEKVVAALKQPFALSQGVVHIGVSVGISLYPIHGDNPEALLTAADNALYQAKSSGKSQHAVYVPAVQSGGLE